MNNSNRDPFNQGYIALVSCFLLFRYHGVEAYQLLVNDSSVDGLYPFYQEMHSVLDDNSSQVVGEMYQDYIYNANGTTRVGTHQGFAFNFDNGTQFNSNDILFLDDGEINSMDPYIVSATGAYEKYQFGTMPNWKVVSFDPYAAQILLIEPGKADVIVDTINDGGKDEDTYAVDSMSFRVTSEGGYYRAIINGLDRKQIGQVFQNPITFPDEDGIYHQNSSSVGINQGYSFNFPDDPHPLGNRQFLFGRWKMIVFNEIVMHATGPYAKFTGATLTEKVISSDPNYVADITVTVPTTSHSDATTGNTYIREEGATYDFRITAEGGFYDPIQGVNDQGNLVQIGERFQNPVFTHSGNRIGTNQGYAFNFPVTSFTREMTMGNRAFFLESGTLNVFNEIIVQATGIYSEFAGGRFQEIIVSSNPIFVSEITMIPASSVEKEGDDVAGTETEEKAEESDGNEGGDMTSSGDAVVAPTLFGLGVVCLFTLVQP